MRTRTAALGAAALALAAALASCAGGNAGTSATGPSTAAPVSPRVSAPVSAAKPLLAGLVDMSSQRSYTAGVAFPAVDMAPVAADPAVFGGIVVNETWAQLEPTAGHEDFADLDASLAVVRAYDSAHPADPVGVRLRVLAGFSAPAWAQSLAGGPFTGISRPSGGPGSLGRWWTPAYRAAWSSFQHALAARYDDDPLVRDVAVSSCTTLSAEPFVMALGPQTIPGLLAAGWTPAAQQACLAGALGDYSGWHRTAVYFPFNTFRTVVDGKAVPDEAVTDQLLAACAAATTPRCLPGNNALRAAAALAGSAPVYATIDALATTHPGLVADFQAAAPNPAADCGAVATAVAHHADAVELWPSAGAIRGFGALPAAQLDALDRALLTHTAPAC